MFGFGPTEIIVVLVIVLIIFGPSKLPELGKSLGKAIRYFKSAANEIEEVTKLKDSINTEEKKDSINTEEKR